MKRNPGSRRSGFTLIELLVVISIIAILTGMLLAGVNRVRLAGYRTQTRDEMSQLASAHGQCIAELKCGYVPSRLILNETGGYNLNNPLEKDSFNWLKSCFPKTDLRGPLVGGKNIGLDWSGLGQRNQTYILEGWQCLVFCLGGIPLRDASGTLAGTKGFSSNPVDPTDWTNPNNPSQPRPSIGPFYQFPRNRLNTNYASVWPSNAYFPGYNDPFGTPYAYFSSYKTSNGYNRYFAAFGTSDCNSLIGTDSQGNTVAAPWPYQQSISASGAITYYNPNSFQIVSAGRDTLFGAGGLWPGGSQSAPANPAGLTTSPGPVNPGSNKYGGDDMSNFVDGLLGTTR